MKVLLAIEGGFSKTLFEDDTKVVKNFLTGFQFARNKNLQSPEAIAVLKAVHALGAVVSELNNEETTTGVWSLGALSAMENKDGKLEVVE